LSAPKSDDVLVVENDAAMCDLMELALEDEGHEVVCSTDPVDGLRLLVQQPSGLILLDVRMPVMDGEAFVRARRAVPCAAPPIATVNRALPLRARAA
jgi:CheY-like chemotaxis protein